MKDVGPGGDKGLVRVWTTSSGDLESGDSLVNRILPRDRTSEDDGDVDFWEQPTDRIPVYFFSAGFPKATSVVPLYPGPATTKVKWRSSSVSCKCRGVAEVNTNVGGLEPVVLFTVAKENAGLFITGAGVDGVVALVVPNALKGVDVVLNTLPFVSGLGPGLEVSCLGATNRCVPVEVPRVVEVEDGKIVHESNPPASLFVAKSSGAAGAARSSCRCLLRDKGSACSRTGHTKCRRVTLYGVAGPAISVTRLSARHQRTTQTSGFELQMWRILFDADVSI